MSKQHSPYEMIKPGFPDLVELSPGSIVAMWRHAERVHVEAERARIERGIPLTEGLPVSEELYPALGNLPEENLPHARAVFQAFAESPLVEDRIVGAQIINRLVRHDHDFGYGLWHRLARDPAAEVRHEATELMRPFFDNSQSPLQREDLEFYCITADEARELVRVADQVDKREIPPFDLGRETLAVALGHAALPDWLRTPGNDA